MRNTVYKDLPIVDQDELVAIFRKNRVTGLSMTATWSMGDLKSMGLMVGESKAFLRKLEDLKFSRYGVIDLTIKDEIE